MSSPSSSSVSSSVSSSSVGGRRGSTTTINPTSVNVIVRFRPPKESPSSTNSKSSDENDTSWYNVINDEASVEITDPRTGNELQFSYDSIFTSESQQVDIFKSLSHVVEGCMNGFNGTILAYGQTSSGKTHTMVGYENNLLTSSDPKSSTTVVSEDKNKLLFERKEWNEKMVNERKEKNEEEEQESDSALSFEGIIPRSINRIFNEIEKSENHIEYSLTASYVELYCEKIRDLITGHKNGEKCTQSRKFQKIDSSDLKFIEAEKGVIMLNGVTEVPVKSKEEILQVLEFGNIQRATSSTLMNSTSSRSHAIFTINLHRKNINNGVIKRAKLVLVDLAGSEKISKTGAMGLRLDEAKKINLSLTVLGMVIKALSEGNAHVPFRDSKLTRLLEESLAGNSRTCLITCVAPERIHSAETISTLRFGERAKLVKTYAKVNEELSIEQLKKLVESLKNENDILRKKLQTYNDKTIVPTSKYTTETATTTSTAKTKRTEKGAITTEVKKETGKTSSSPNLITSSGYSSGSDQYTVTDSEDLEDEGDNNNKNRISSSLIFSVEGIELRKALDNERKERITLEKQLMGYDGHREEMEALRFTYLELERTFEEEIHERKKLEEDLSEMEERARKAEKQLESFMNLKMEVATVKRSISHANTLNLTMLNTSAFREDPQINFSGSLSSSKFDYNNDNREENTELLSPSPSTYSTLRNDDDKQSFDQGEPGMEKGKAKHEEGMDESNMKIKSLEEELATQTEAFNVIGEQNNEVIRRLLEINTELVVEKDRQCREIFHLESKLRDLSSVMNRYKKVLEREEEQEKGRRTSLQQITSWVRGEN